MVTFVSGEWVTYMKSWQNEFDGSQFSSHKDGKGAKVASEQISAQKMRFSIKDFSSKYDHYCGFGHIYWRNL